MLLFWNICTWVGSLLHVLFSQLSVKMSAVVLRGHLGLSVSRGPVVQKPESSQFRCTCSCAVRSQCVMTPCECRQRRCKSAVWSAGLDDVHFGGILETARPCKEMWCERTRRRRRGDSSEASLRTDARIPIGDSTVSIRCWLLALREISTIKNNY